MKITCRILAVLLGAILWVGCSGPPVPTLTPTQTRIIQPTTLQENVIPLVTDMSWDQESKTIHVNLDTWPGGWPWQILLDGEEIPEQGVEGQASIMPDAPLEEPPRGLFIGSLPWLSGLEETDFPCCGSLQFDIPGVGLTNAFEYNFGGLCQTRSTKACPAAWTIHDGVMEIAAGEEFVIESTNFLQNGNILIRANGTLTVRNAELMLGRGDTPTVHLYIFIDPGGILNLDNAGVSASRGDGLPCVINRGTLNMVNSPTSIHYLDMSADARLTMVNSTLVNELGGILQVTGGSTQVSSSTLGALGLSVPDGAHLVADGIKPGTHFATFDIHDLIPEADYDLLLTDVTLLEDFPDGEYEHGPYERGWIFFISQDAHIRLANSELRKVFLDIRNDTATFTGLQVDVPVDLVYRDIQLNQVVISGQWPFTITNSDLTLQDSNYLFLQPTGNSTIHLIDSHMVEFIPRDFYGTMVFENATWTVAGEIIGSVPYHSNSNDFRMTGSLQIADELRTNLRWKNAQVTREYEVIVTDPAGMPVKGAVIKISGREYITGTAGSTFFELKFNETNYALPLVLEAWQQDELLASRQVDFFTSTPIKVGR